MIKKCQDGEVIDKPQTLLQGLTKEHIYCKYLPTMYMKYHCNQTRNCSKADSSKPVECSRYWKQLSLKLRLQEPETRKKKRNCSHNGSARTSVSVDLGTRSHKVFTVNPVAAQ